MWSVALRGRVHTLVRTRVQGDTVFVGNVFSGRHQRTALQQ